MKRIINGLLRHISDPAYKDMENTDLLTGVQNRNAYQKELDRLTQEGKLEGIGLAVIDLNGLRKVNDGYGYGAGDSFLRIFAKAYHMVKGEKGILYRIGGDEFVIIVKGCTEEMLEELIRALKSKFDHLKSGEQYSFSYGFQIFDPLHDRNLTDTYHRADAAMYLYKRRFYEKYSDHHQFDLRHHMIQQSVINVLSYEYTSYQVFDLETESLLDYGINDEHLRPMIEENIAKSTYSEGIVEYFAPLLVAEDREDLSEKMNIENIRNELKANREYRIRGRIAWEGKYIYIELSFFRMQENENRKNFIVAYRDVTEQVKKEEEQKRTLREALYNAEVASKAKTNFLFNMSHDIRTPMNAIIGFTKIAKEHIEETDRVKEYLDKVDYASQHLLKLINDILDMARIESGKVELELKPVSIREGVLETKEVFQTEMLSKNIHFDVQLDLRDDRVLCDPLRIRQIAWNLLSNALKYTPSGGSVSYCFLQTGREEGGYGTYELRVKDSGIGMSEEFQKCMFDIFEREKTSTESGEEGTGLGLAITKRLVELQGGTIEVQSRKNAGSEFIVRLKMKLAEFHEHEAESDQTQELTKAGDFSGRRILVAEDNMLNREIAEIILKEHGFYVDTAEDGEVAVEKIAASAPGDYDLVLMDIQMPNLNGYEATRKIRQLKDPFLARIPIVAMTANAFEEDRRKSRDAGMNGHIAKPIDVSELLEILGKVFNS